MSTLVIECHMSTTATDRCPAIFHYPNGGGFRDLLDLQRHWHLMPYVNIPNGVEFIDRAARPYGYQKWTLKDG